MYASLAAAVADLEAHGHLVRVSEELDPNLEIAEVHRRVFEAGGPAVMFERVKGSPFPAVSNLFGSIERSRFLFRNTLSAVQQVIRAKADPAAVLANPLGWMRAPFTAWWSLPSKAWSAPVMAHQTTVDQLPQIQSWPDDGGAFVTLPQVYTEDPDQPGVMQSNLGMYRVQLSGNQYTPDRIGMHYQIHRGIGVHHTAANRLGQPLKVSVFVGGPPAHTLAAVMPLPEGLSELVFAGMMAGRRFRYQRTPEGHLVSADADFCIVGTIEGSETLPEGPFGDHLGYYSLTHDFPVMKVEGVYHRKNAIWPFTVVHRPPAEDSMFGKLIGELVAPMVPTTIPGVKGMHAVDAAGVHPLLCALGSERYVPWEERRAPQEILTQANAILGFSHASLAKYLLIAAHEDAPELDVHDVSAFFPHVMARFDPRRDLHFITRTTIDTLDYSGTGWNEGSKVIFAAAGPEIRRIGTEVPAGLDLPSPFSKPRVAMPGILLIQGPAFGEEGADVPQVLVDALAQQAGFDTTQTPFPWVVLVDDSDFTSAHLNNFLWVTFTRSNPSHDIHGVGASIQHKHWGCEGSVVIDARMKPHHAPPLVEKPEVTRRVDDLAAKGGPLHGLF
jgi:4-hydroxy-3-polyprenylbenzoate decarboxylase